MSDAIDHFNPSLAMVKKDKPKATKYPLAKARRHFSAVIESVAYFGARVEITKHGKVVAMIVPCPETRRPPAAA